MILDTSYSQRILQAQLKIARPVPPLWEANTRPKFLIELADPTQDKIVFKKFPDLSKK